MSQAIQGLKYNTVNIESLDGEKKIDLTNSILSTDYFEDILEPCVSATIEIVSTYNIVEALPIRGGEKVVIDLETLSGSLKREFRVYKVSNINSERQSESCILHLVPDEYLNNELTRCVKKYKKIRVNYHVKDILENVLKTKDIGIIEETSNSYSFIGNTKKPFHTLQWLGPKSVSLVTKKSGVSGKDNTKIGKAKGTAGFIFFQNKDGFNFRSIDTLASRTKVQISSADNEDIFTYTAGGVTQANKFDNATEIIQHFFEKNIDLRKSLRVGMYSNMTYHYSTTTHLVSAYKYKLKEELESSEKLGSESRIEVLDTFGNSPSRVLFSVSDNGVLSSNGGEEDSGLDLSSSAKSFARYNLLFTQALNILIPCNTNLKVGDIIRCYFPVLEAGRSKKMDGQTSGLYLIKELRHHFSANQNTTSLRLVRDSYGIK